MKKATHKHLPVSFFAEFYFWFNYF